MDKSAAGNATLSSMRSGAIVEDVPLGSLHTSYDRFRLVRPREYARMVDSMKRYGQISPGTAGRVLDRKDRFELVDGFKRYRACVELGIPSMSLRIVESGPHALKAALINLNRSQGQVHAFEEALVAGSLYREDLLNQEQIAVLFGRHKSWSSRRIALCERLCEEAIGHIRLGLIGFATARELWRLPRGNQADALSCVMKHRLNSRETGELVGRLLQSPKWEWDILLRQPIDILSKRCPPKPPGSTSNRKAEREYARLFSAFDTLSLRTEAVQPYAMVISGQQRGVALERINRTVDKLAQLKTTLEGKDHGDF